ncbi:phosphoribosylaminoimidazolesuccinocarboxamide synthase [Salinadaptatus halalkaliphilus]|uniref:Phosphoribosylaminoimidazole-succinocarboxamide synthase n=1 Tax=Salinadaptatus halalkaliphilus TaxID=2419781 RepID=A0A4S3TSR7_9EURY|nr:phosphoribosylaminoimidazolesuccinocarboxamide synthase [Salinadaptatus halalkaliphilus]THE66770.1 phosphoribosylaminoimidazolesuccinocarboxamide synthase [Salinadaptatus halalkaliphilus]
MTSVKEFRVETSPTADSLGRGAFIFTDDYSVFDWGKMPDQIPQKGASLCTMGAYNFELLEADDIPTHYRGVVDPAANARSSDSAGTAEERQVVSLAETTEPPREMAIALTQVPDLPNDGREYDYDHYHDAAADNYLIPLEIVFRNRVPVGSSLRQRTEPADHDLGFDRWPDDAVDLAEPIVEFSTKYEESDRYLEREEADAIAGLASIDDLETLAREVNRVLTDRAQQAGLKHEDGKIECLYVDGELRVADVVGTFDENRFSYEGTQLSKEVLRQYHKRTQPEWVQAVEAAKAEAKRTDVADWKSLCETDPVSLEASVLETARDLYCAGTNAYTGEEWFDAPPLSSAIGAVRRL